jgi:hypothetical protein
VTNFTLVFADDGFVIDDDDVLDVVVTQGGSILIVLADGQTWLPPDVTQLVIHLCFNESEFVEFYISNRFVEELSLFALDN